MMLRFLKIYVGAVALLAGVLGLYLFTSCGEIAGETITLAETAIVKELQGKGVWERGNLPDDPAPDPDDIKGYYDIVAGAYRHVVNEAREGRESAREIGEGDVVGFWFDGRVYGSSFESSTTFYTNIAARREMLSGGNSEFDPTFWPIDKLEITLSDDPDILKPLQRALVGCREGDQVRVYLTPDMAFGAATVYTVPGGQTLVWEITDLTIMDN